jgi:outer membrane protein OmpA-like peptidoglycan-associated protein/tetratricopeptide (TPR) repeat protein
LSLFVFISSCQAQPLYTQSKKAKKLYDDAVTFYRSGKVDYAEEYLNKALEKDPNFINAYLLKADIMQGKNNKIAAVNIFQKVIQINPDYRAHTYYQLATLEMDLMRYREAAENYRNYLKSPKTDPRLQKKVNHLIDQCEVAAELIENPVPFDPVNLGKNVNSEANEYANALSTERNNLLFTVMYKVNNQRREAEDFFYSRQENNQGWQSRQKLPGKFNSPYDEGAMTISPDGSLIIFASNRPGGEGRYDLYYSRKQGGVWTNPQNMGKGVNTEYWESQPTISSDGKTVYFVSDRKGGMGGSDIYFVTLQEDGSYGKPYNLGYPINTSGNEMTPFIHQDASTLYFVSNGHLGMGGNDIFMARKNNKGVFSDVKNMGYPINTKGNELGLIVDATGQLAYYSSDNDAGFGGYDIYYFSLPESTRPIPVNYLKGIAYDKETKQKLKVDFQLYNLKTNALWIQSTSDQKTGEFLVVVPAGTELGLNAYHEGYLFYSDHFYMDSLSGVDKPFLKNVPMTPVKVGEKIILKNILFATASYELRPESKNELEKLFELLTMNPGLKIELSGHTDNVGNKEDNQILSENRAKAVYQYLIDRGIAKNRLVYKGYGQDEPIADNTSAEGRQENRRTEMKIIAL